MPSVKLRAVASWAGINWGRRWEAFESTVGIRSGDVRSNPCRNGLGQEVFGLRVGKENGFARAVLLRVGRVGALGIRLLGDDLRAFQGGIDFVGPVGHFRDEDGAFQSALVDGGRVHEDVE